MHKKVVIPEQIIYTVSEISKILKVNKNKIYEYIHSGLLEAMKIGSYKVSHSALISFVEKYKGMDITNVHDIRPIRKEGNYEREC